ncbi:MAG: MarC family protein [Myxococcota bacterium]
MDEHIQAIVTVLSLINPAVCVGMFTRIERGQSPNARRGDAAKAALAVFVILVIAALVGTRILQVFGLSIDAFMVAGGVVLGWMGFSMLASGSEYGSARGGESPNNTSLTPLILFAASPGTITGVITVSAAHSVYGIPETALVAVAVGALLLWAVLVLSVRFATKGKGPGLWSETATRFMGLIVLAMGVQFGLRGFRSFMNATGTG